MRKPVTKLRDAVAAHPERFLVRSQPRPAPGELPVPAAAQQSRLLRLVESWRRELDGAETEHQATDEPLNAGGDDASTMSELERAQSEVASLTEQLAQANCELERLREELAQRGRPWWEKFATAYRHSR